MIDITIPDELIDSQFFATLDKLNIHPDEDLRPLDASGNIVRFAVDGDRRGEKSGAYYLYADGLPNWGVMVYGVHERMVQDKFRFDRMSRREQDILRAANPQARREPPHRPDIRRELPAESRTVSREPSAVSREPAAAVSREPSAVSRMRAAHSSLQLALARYREGLTGPTVDTHPFIRRRFTEHGVILPEISGFDLWGTDRLAKNAPRKDRQSGNLLFPLVHIATGTFTGLQWYGTRRNDAGHWAKGFFAGTMPKGSSFCISPIGAREGLVYVVEGIATGLALLALIWRQRQEAVTVHCALSAANIRHVCAALRCTGDFIIIAADNDEATAAKTGKNVGVQAAEDTKNAGLADRVEVPAFVSPEAPQNVDWYDVLLRFVD